MAPTRRNKKKEKKLIPFEPDYDESTVQQVKYKRYEETDDGEREEVEKKCPILHDGASAHYILWFFDSFFVLGDMAHVVRHTHSKT